MKIILFGMFVYISSFFACGHLQLKATASTKDGNLFVTKTKQK